VCVCVCHTHSIYREHIAPVRVHERAHMRALGAGLWLLQHLYIQRERHTNTDTDTDTDLVKHGKHTHTQTNRPWQTRYTHRQRDRPCQKRSWRPWRAQLGAAVCLSASSRAHAVTPRHLPLTPCLKRERERAKEVCVCVRARASTHSRWCTCRLRPNQILGCCAKVGTLTAGVYLRERKRKRARLSVYWLSLSLPPSLPLSGSLARSFSLEPNGGSASSSECEQKCDRKRASQQDVERQREGEYMASSRTCANAAAPSIWPHSANATITNPPFPGGPMPPITCCRVAGLIWMKNQSKFDAFCKGFVKMGVTGLWELLSVTGRCRHRRAGARRARAAAGRPRALWCVAAHFGARRRFRASPAERARAAVSCPLPIAIQAAR